MAKIKQFSDTNQTSLFDLIKKQHDERKVNEPQAGTLNITYQLQEVLHKCMGQCSLSRDMVAGKMSELTGMTITRFMIDAWISSAKAKHRFPCEYLPAFCAAINNHEPIAFLARKAGVFAMPDKDVLRSELVKMIEVRDQANGEIKKMKLYLKEMD